MKTFPLSERTVTPDISPEIRPQTGIPGMTTGRLKVGRDCSSELWQFLLDLNVLHAFSFYEHLSNFN